VAEAPVILAGLRRRSDFLAANGGRRWATPGFVLLERVRGDDDSTIRVGFTVTKKIGGAVERNRLKRRLRALARTALPQGGRPGSDYVVIGRDEGLTRTFAAMATDFAKGLARLPNKSAEKRAPRRQAALTDGGNPGEEPGS
jgi:ribonuclease P protein component